jgi:lysozyme
MKSRDLSLALELIKRFEGLSLTPYLCPAGIPTIGYGTVKYPDGKDVSLKDSPISQETAEKYLAHHVAKTSYLLGKYLDSREIELNDRQFCSLLSFGYNCGLAPIVVKGKMINSGLANKDKSLVAKGIMAYTKATVGGKKVTLPGLVKRRQAEVELYLGA